MGLCSVAQDEGMSLEESLGEEERARRKAEKRRAKKKVSVSELCS